MKFLYNILITIIITIFLTSCSSISNKIDFAGIIDSTERWLFGDEVENNEDISEDTIEIEEKSDNIVSSIETEEVFPDIEDIPEQRPDFEEIDKSFFNEEEDIEIVENKNETQLVEVEIKEKAVSNTTEENNILAVMNIRNNIRFKLVELFRNSDPPIKETAPFITENILDKESTKLAIIQFPNNSIIPDRDSNIVINEIIKSYSSKKIKLVGHASKLGGSDVAGKRKNMEISIARAETIKNMLINKGFDADKIFTFGKGDIEPLKEEEKKYGEAVNRRVEVFFISE